MEEKKVVAAAVLHRRTVTRAGNMICQCDGLLFLIQKAFSILGRRNSDNVPEHFGKSQSVIW
ncbi:hypothetical protein [Bariatricus sp. HCP28S3_H2]|uniref:hypothetical protein n=1 Tax=Bariatricus sp. HCP28S3_H2 TaxID=3438905 RepID=UPI003F8CF132